MRACAGKALKLKMDQIGGMCYEDSEGAEVSANRLSAARLLADPGTLSEGAGVSANSTPLASQTQCAVRYPVPGHGSKGQRALASRSSS